MRSARLIALLVVLVPLTAQAQPSANPALIDLHFHAERGLSPDKVLQTMDQVVVAGNGAKGADNLWEPFVLASASRFLPFGGQGPIGRMVQELGERAWTLKADPMISYLESLERGLRAGRFRGIGELFVNNTNSHPRSLSPTKYPADRFLAGTDADDLGQYRDIIDFYRKVLGQLSPAAAQRIGSGNAKRIFRLD